MRVSKTILSFAAILLLLYSVYIPRAQAPTAGDVQNQWATGYIETALHLGLVSNYPDGTFKPNQPVTRAEFIKMLVNTGGIKSPTKSKPTFADVGPSNWAYPYVEAAVYAGIVPAKGATPRYFRPDQTVDRQEMAQMVGRLMTVEGLPGMPTTTNGTVDWLAMLRKKGIVLNLPGDDFKADSPLTRAQACVIALRLEEQILAAQAAKERQWISSAQSSAGYLTMSVGNPDINPYFANLSEMALLGHPQYLAGVKDYLQWALSKLNYPDLWNLNGTIYNLRVVNGVAQSAYSYDSADSYAATLLSLAAGYYYSSNDSSFIRSQLPQLSTVAQVITKLQDEDGLVQAKPNSQYKYLMDNCESYRGLEDWASLLSSLGLKSQGKFYAGKADLIKNGILKHLWDESTDTFAWAVNKTDGKFLPSRGQAYPGIFAQVYPVIFGVISPTNIEAVLAYQTLNTDLPDWPELKVDDSFPWAILGYAAVQMGDLSRANLFLENLRSAYILQGRKYPWSTFEDAYYVRTSDTLRARISASLN